jgi:hypothetical protein
LDTDLLKKSGEYNQEKRVIPVERCLIGIVLYPANPLAMPESINTFLSDSKLQNDCRDKLKS